VVLEHNPSNLNRKIGLRPVALIERGVSAHLRAIGATVGTLRASHERRVEAPPGFEPGMEVLQGHPR
jgi:hypothetical protein